jgi:hypothetical protein
VEKANTYTLVTVMNASSMTESGTWAWMKKDKGADLKNKEAVIVLPNKNTLVNTTTNGPTDDAHVKVLDELRKSEMIIKMDKSSDNGLGDNNGQVVTETGTKTYKQ